LGPEIFFNPEIFSSDFLTPLSEVVDTGILNCPIDTRRGLFKVRICSYTRMTVTMHALTPVPEYSSLWWLHHVQRFRQAITTGHQEEGKASCIVVLDGDVRIFCFIQVDSRQKAQLALQTGVSKVSVSRSVAPNARTNIDLVCCARVQLLMSTSSVTTCKDLRFGSEEACLRQHRNSTECAIPRRSMMRKAQELRGTTPFSRLVACNLKPSKTSPQLKTKKPQND
jgi:hypothetical protein